MVPVLHYIHKARLQTLSYRQAVSCMPLCCNMTQIYEKLLGWNFADASILAPKCFERVPEDFLK